MQNLNKLEHIKSWIITFLTDFSYEILIGLAALIQTGDITKVSLLALGYASFRTAAKLTIEFIASQIKKDV